MTAPKADAVSVALDKLERCYADLCWVIVGLPTAEQETVPAARAEHARNVKALAAAVELAAYCRGYFCKPGETPKGEPTIGRDLIAAFDKAVQP